MTRTEYATYLQSAHWQNLRKETLAEIDSCDRCSLPRWVARLAYDQDLHLHHKTYVNLGNEQPEDIEVLCAYCHDIETFGRSNLRQVKRSNCSICRYSHWNPYSDLCPVCRELFTTPWITWNADSTYDPTGETVTEMLLNQIIWSVGLDGLVAATRAVLKRRRERG